MEIKIITNRYWNETGKSAYRFNWFGKKIHNQDYIDWLEIQITNKNISSKLTEPYLKVEKDWQLREMEKLGINTKNQLFEQCVNGLIYRLKATPKD